MKLKNQDVTQIIDPSTGEVVSVTTSKTYSFKTNNEEFYMTFIDLCSSLFKITSLVDMKVLVKLCTIAEFNTGKVYLPTALRDEICIELSISSQQLSNSLYSLKKKEMINGKRGIFHINPLLFWKGTTDARNSVLRELNVTVSIL